MKLFSIIFTTILLVSCIKSTNQENAQKAVCCFTDAFFNYQYGDAIQYCSESDKYLIQVYISNISATDFDSIRTIPRKAQVSSCTINESIGDSLILSTVTVNNAYILKQLGKKGKYIDQLQIPIKATKRGEKWEIDIADFLQALE